MVRDSGFWKVRAETEGGKVKCVASDYFLMSTPSRGERAMNICHWGGTARSRMAMRRKQAAIALRRDRNGRTLRSMAFCVIVHLRRNR